MRDKTFISKLGIAMLFCAIIMSSGCGNDDQNYLFEVDHGFDIQLPAGGSSLSLVIPFYNISSLVESELAKRNLTADDIRSIQTVRARIDLVSFDGTLSDYEEVVVNVYSGVNPLDDPHEAGYTIQIKNQSIDRIDIVPSLTNLTKVLERSIFNMELVMRPRRISPRAMDARFTISFGVVQ